MTELNNLALGELPQAIREETLMEGYWSLIESAAAYCAELRSAGVRYLVDVFEVAADAERMKVIVVADHCSGERVLRVLDDHKPIGRGILLGKCMPKALSHGRLRGWASPIMRSGAICSLRMPMSLEMASCLMGKSSMHGTQSASTIT